MNRFRILIVDDDPGQRARLAIALNSQFEVAASRNGREAIKKLAVIEPDIVIAVSQLADMDAMDFIADMRSIREYRETLVLITAVRASHETIDPDKPVVTVMESNSDTGVIVHMLQREIALRGLLPVRKNNTLDELRENAARDLAVPLVGRDDAQGRPSAAAPARPVQSAHTPIPINSHRAAAPAAPTIGRGHMPFPMPKKDGKARVMIVDDDMDVQNILRLALNAKYRIYSAKDGMDGLNQAQLHRPDLFIVDWMMPKMTGPQLIKMLRQTPVFAKTPVIVVTAKTQAPQQSMLDELGVKIYMTKPFDVEELAGAVERELAAAAAH